MVVSVLENDGGEGSEQLSRDAAAAADDDDDDDDELLRIGMLPRQCRSRLEGAETYDRYIPLIPSDPSAEDIS